ncbi:MAG: hypothetical protein EPO32_14020 [Anaerolineae bacterium]|nr:MAG: hypothetical protein EPO32_14020 [Anaerolineae bacterium]
MNIWTALILGILIGWLVEWVIDWLYWRRRSGSADEIARLRAQLHARRDPLEVIHGIGPVIADKLNAAGIYTFEGLAELAPADMETIIGPEIKNLADEASLIKEARELAEIRAGTREDVTPRRKK